MVPGVWDEGKQRKLGPHGPSFFIPFHSRLCTDSQTIPLSSASSAPLCVSFPVCQPLQTSTAGWVRWRWAWVEKEWLFANAFTSFSGFHVFPSQSVFIGHLLLPFSTLGFVLCCLLCIFLGALVTLFAKNSCFGCQSVSLQVVGYYTVFVRTVQTSLLVFNFIAQELTTSLKWHVF